MPNITADEARAIREDTPLDAAKRLGEYLHVLQERVKGLEQKVAALEDDILRRGPVGSLLYADLQGKAADIFNPTD